MRFNVEEMWRFRKERVRWAFIEGETVVGISWQVTGNWKEKFTHQPNGNMICNLSSVFLGCKSKGYDLIMLAILD